MQNFREKMIGKAIQFLPTQGCAGITLMNVARACKAPRGSLYHYFPGGKDDLMDGVLAAAQDYGLGILVRSCSDAPSLDAYLDAIADALSAGLAKSKFTLGCPVAAISMSTENTSPLNRKCKDIYTAWCETLETRLIDYGIPEQTASVLAINILNVFQGALLHARIARSSEPIAQAALLLQRAARMEHG
jgi:TetR/AcrR family transcriptional regulator, lmrAB and yxaGH operons repressor